MTDPEIPSSYLPVVLSDLSNRGADQNQPPGRWNLTSRAVLDTCNSYRGGGTARFTQYWIPIEGMQDAPLGIPATSRAFYDACHTQGTCFTRNKVLLNLVGHQCFRALNRQRFPFGIGSRNNALEPFVSVAVNDLPFGTFLFLRELYGKVVPGTGGKVHNGCVRVDDVGWGLDPCHVDFFALTYFRWKPQNWGTRVTARVVPRCRVGSYVSSALGR
ncbi:hypothetical protein DFJ74DRAFT_714802 [Hyaloraphidium curvatum]|nr:hypothetical protein DFJ74DRAFT_714802 [Hyaloraphidium curvatum]